MSYTPKIALHKVSLIKTGVNQQLQTYPPAP